MKLLRGLAAGDLALIAGDRTAQFLVFYPLILGWWSALAWNR